MRLLDALRRRRIERIEYLVASLNTLIDAIDETVVDNDEWEEYLREERARLWLQRSNLVKKLPPEYEGVT